MNIAFAADDKYAQHVSVTLASILANAESSTDIHVYVVSGDLSTRSVERLRALRSVRDFTLTVLYVDPSDFADCSITRHTVVMYFRFRLPALLPSVDRIIYLDSDVVVRDSLEPLWKTDMRGACLAACPDAIELVVQSHEPQAIRASSSVYYNSGVLLMDLNAMRKDESELRLVTWIRDQTMKGPLRFPDQDAINAVYGPDIVQLPLEWNYQYPLFDHYELISTSPKIVHFTTQNKPWKYRAVSRFSDEYWRYLAFTPWRGARPEGRTALAILRRAARSIRKRHLSPMPRNLSQA